MRLNYKVLGIAAVVGTFGLSEARAQEVSPGDRTLRRELFTAFLLGQREINSQERLLRSGLRVTRRQDLLLVRRQSLQARNPLSPAISRLTRQINSLQDRFLQILSRLIQGIPRVQAALARIRELAPDSPRLARLERRAALQEQLIETFQRRPPPDRPPATPVGPGNPPGPPFGLPPGPPA